VTTDWDIRENVLRELAWEPRVNESQIGVQALEGIVILGGIVSDGEIARAACAAAHRAPGVKDVINELSVEAPGADAPDDLTIARAVRRELASTRATDGPEVRTVIATGVVTLSGVVHSPAARAAAAASVGRVEGVKRIDNELSVDPRAARVAVEHAVRSVIRAYRSDQATALKISVADGRVHISGIVVSPEERRALLDAIHAVPGVDAVDESLAVAEV